MTHTIYKWYRIGYYKGENYFLGVLLYLKDLRIEEFHQIKLIDLNL